MTDYDRKIEASRAAVEKTLPVLCTNFLEELAKKGIWGERTIRIVATNGMLSLEIDRVDKYRYESL